VYALYIVVCPFVLFLLAIVLSVLRYTDSDNFLLLLQAQVCNKCGSILSPCLERPPSSNAAVSAESERKWTCYKIGTMIISIVQLNVSITSPE
jgi:hypothetical protein